MGTFIRRAQYRRHQKNQLKVSTLIWIYENILLYLKYKMREFMEKKIDFSEVTYKFRGSYVQTIFDRVQTHALYGISKSQKDEAKEALKKIGAKRFRVVNNDFGMSIICFKIN